MAKNTTPQKNIDAGGGGFIEPKKSPLDGLTPEQQAVELAHARAVLRASSEFVIDGLTEKAEQLYTLGWCLLNELTPPDKNNPPDDWPIQAWRLAQVLDTMLTDQTEIKNARVFLLGEE